MNKRDLERAERLVEKARLAERTERCRDEQCGWVLTAFWLGGDQAIYSNLAEVKSAIKWRQAVPSRV